MSSNLDAAILDEIGRVVLGVDRFRRVVPDLQLAWDGKVPVQRDSERGYGDDRKVRSVELNDLRLRLISSLEGAAAAKEKEGEEGGKG